MMKTYHGTCDCGATEMSISLPMALDHYAPRACDCDFCTRRQISYLSDPQGTIAIKSLKPLTELQQGSNTATFLSCAVCLTVMCVSYSNDTRCVGALNASRLTEKKLLKPPVSVSPKTLTAAEKTERWLLVWSPLALAEKAQH